MAELCLPLYDFDSHIGVINNNGLSGNREEPMSAQITGRFWRSHVGPVDEVLCRHNTSILALEWDVE